MAAFRLTAAIGLFLAFFVLFSFVWTDYLELHGLAFVTLSLLLCLAKGWKSWLKELYLLLPFVSLLMAVYLLFGLAGMGGEAAGNAKVAYWLGFGSIRMLLLVNTLLCIRVAFGMVSWDNVLRLPLGIRWMKYLILGRVLYRAAFDQYRELEMHQRLVPSVQREQASPRRRIRRKLESVLALTLFTLAEARHKGEMIDNRILQCHGKDQVIWFQAVGLTVLAMVATLLIRVPMPSGGYLNFGDVVVVFAGMYGGRKVGAIAGGIGSAAADLIGFPIFAPVTLLAKGLEGWLCGWAMGANKLAQYVFPALGVTAMMGIYFAGTLLMPQLGLAAALADLPGNVLQACLGYLSGRSLWAVYQTIDS